jgi:hypothetical protein
MSHMAHCRAHPLLLLNLTPPASIVHMRIAKAKTCISPDGSS